MFNQQQIHQVENTAQNDLDQTMKAAPLSEEPTNNKSVMENTDIYYMPENFQKNNDVAGRNINVSGIVILVLGILFLVLLGGGLYIYLVNPGLISDIFSRNQQNTNQISTPVVQTPTSTETLSVSQTKPAGAPKDTYLAFRSEMELANTIESYMAVFARYGSKAKQQQLASQRASLESVGGQGDILSALKGKDTPPLDGTENITEDISDQRAVLTVSKTSGRMIGTVIFVAEDEQWKISEETWSEQAATEGENNSISAAADDDKDGLSNSEEALLGTNAKASDSDGDGYNDLEEINNGYNPAGIGKLSSNASLGTYLNTTFNFSLLYPVDWDRTIASSDDSIIFTAGNKQFIQILVQPNSNQSDIVDWYRSTFNTQTIPNNQLVVNDTWSGVKSPDGLTVYLTNKEKTYIFVMTYNLGASKVTEFKYIFDMAVRNLKLGV